MLLYATEFPARSDATIEEFLSVCHKWLTGSQHYPFKSLLAVTAPDGDVQDLSREGHELRVAVIEEEADRRAGVRHSWTEAARRVWTTEVVAAEDAEGLWISVTVSCDVLEPGASPPVPKKPYLIKQLFAELGGGTDGGFTIRDAPHHLVETDIDRAVAFLTGESPNRLPIVYVSRDFTGYPEIDVDHLARLLGGIAHVVVEPSRSFSVFLGRRVGGINPWGGAVGLCWPGPNGRRTKYLRKHYASSYDLIGDVEAGVRAGWLFWRSPRNNTWAYINEAISIRRLTELRERRSESIDDYMAAFDQENTALREQLQRADARNRYLEEIVRGVQEREIARGDVLFASGAEQELYPGELKDVVLRTLNEDMANLTQGSRRQVLLAAFRAANTPSDTGEKLEEGIKEVLSKTDRVGPTELKRLESLGFVITDEGKHYKALYGGDPRLTFTVFKTASDHRAGKNLSSDICKKILKR
jgi:hypothetical protein